MATDPRDTRDDLGMMKRPDLWPLWPHLPVKKGPWVTGVITEGENGEGWPYVFGHDGSDIAGYETLEALLADGWVVD